MRTTCKKPCVCSCNFIFKIQNTQVQLHRRLSWVWNRWQHCGAGTAILVLPPFCVHSRWRYSISPHPRTPKIYPTLYRFSDCFLIPSCRLYLLPKLELAQRRYSFPRPSTRTRHRHIPGAALRQPSPVEAFCSIELSPDTCLAC